MELTTKNFASGWGIALETTGPFTKIIKVKKTRPLLHLIVFYDNLWSPASRFQVSFFFILVVIRFIADRRKCGYFQGKNQQICLSIIKQLFTNTQKNLGVDEAYLQVTKPPYHDTIQACCNFMLKTSATVQCLKHFEVYEFSLGWLLSVLQQEWQMSSEV